jgi:hypothetical protein
LQDAGINADCSTFANFKTIWDKPLASATPTPTLVKTSYGEICSQKLYTVTGDPVTSDRVWFSLIARFCDDLVAANF